MPGQRSASGLTPYGSDGRQQGAPARAGEVRGEAPRQLLGAQPVHEQRQVRAVLFEGAEWEQHDACGDGARGPAPPPRCTRRSGRDGQRRGGGSSRGDSKSQSGFHSRLTKISYFSALPNPGKFRPQVFIQHEYAARKRLSFGSSSGRPFQITTVRTRFLLRILYYPLLHLAPRGEPGNHVMKVSAAAAAGQEV